MPAAHVLGCTLHYELIGSGEPVLLIHGLGSSSRDWEYQTAALAPNYRIIAPDLRGHGRSQRPPGPYSMGGFANDLIALLDHLHIAQAHVVGLSLGGGIAFQLATQAPERVRSLTIVNSGPELVPRSTRQKLGIWQRYAIVHLLGLKRMAKVLSRRLFPEDVALQKSFIERFSENDTYAYLSAMRAFVGWSVASQLPAISCPVLVIAADQDYTPVSAKHAYVAQMPNARLVVIDDARHAVPVEKPDTFNRCLLEFLNTCRA